MTPQYRPSKYVDADLAGPIAPMEPVLSRLDSLLQKPIKLTGDEFDQLVSFVRYGLRDDRSLFLSALIPHRLISGQIPMEFGLVKSAILE